MSSLLTGLAELFIEWVDDRFGRTAAWIAGIDAGIMLTVGVVVIGIVMLHIL